MQRFEGRLVREAGGRREAEAWEEKKKTNRRKKIKDLGPFTQELTFRNEIIKSKEYQLWKQSMLKVEKMHRSPLNKHANELLNGLNINACGWE